jgi:hypothetical protein
VLENADFIAWANENVVLVVGHKGSQHKPPAAKDSKDPKTGKGAKDDPAPPPEEPAPNGAADGCSLYPGLSCAEHEKIMEDATTGGTPKLEVKGYPTSYMVAPDGTFVKHTSDREPKACMNALIDYQKKFKIKIPGKKYAGYIATVADGDAAVAAGKWKDALTAYGKIDAEGKKLASLQTELKGKVDALNAKVVEAFGRLKDGDGDAVAKNKSIKSLRADVSAKLSTGALPVLADIDEWLKANPAPVPAK